MEFYRLFKKIIGIKSPRIKLLMLAAGKLAGSRFIGIYVDPVMACNIRCRMCYFSDPASRPKPVGTMTREYMETLRPVMKKALKMQIGCGAEPTLYKNLAALIAAGKEARVPFIEMTTNGQLLTLENMREYCRAGLDGITLSLHGTTRDTYEYLMQGADFQKFRNLLRTLSAIQKEYPRFKVRVNYTLNNLNKHELPGIWDLFEGVHIDTLQVRPIQKLGDTAYNDFLIEDYRTLITDIIEPLGQECRRRSTIALLPSAENIERLNRKTTLANALIEDITYCYVGPRSCYKEDFDPGRESLSAFQRRTGLTRRLWKAIFTSTSEAETLDINKTKKLNYS